MSSGEKLSYHILPAAGTMLGICTTLIGLVKVAEAQIGSSRVDEYSAVTALLFLTSALSSYLALREGSLARYGRWFESMADVFFIAGLVGISFVSLLFAYEVI